MSKYSIRHLNENVRQGFISEKLKAWHFAGVDTNMLIANGQAFEGPVPLEVAESILGFVPQERKIYVEGDDGFPELVADRKAIVLPASADCPTMSKRISYIGTDGYKIHDPKHTVMDSVIALTEAGAELASVGKLGGGRLAFTSWRSVEGRLSVPGFGTLQAYINAGTSTDGSLATTQHASAVLQVCDNTAACSLARAGKRVYKLRHTSGSVYDVNAAREAIEISVSYAQSVADQLERMTNVQITEADMYRIVNKMLPIPEEDGRSRTTALNKHGEILKMFFNDERVPGDVRLTIAGAWQAVHTQGTWGREVRGNSDPVGKQWERTLRSDSVDAEFWAVVKELELAPESLLVGV